VAKRFGVTRRFVEGRLRLAALAEPVAVDVSESSASSPVSTMTGTS
jgi:ParB family chromosome partitioning protein